MTTARKLVDRLLVFSPVILLAAIATNARTYSDAFVPVESNPSWDRKVYAYADIVHRAQTALEDPNSDRNDYHRLAREWIGKCDGGQLKPIPPAFYEQFTMEGPRGDVIAACFGVSANLMRSSRPEARRGNWRLAADSLLTAAELSQCAKYFDFVTVSRAVLEQRRALELLEPILDKLSKDDLKAVHQRVLELRDHQENLGRMALFMRRQYADFRVRQGDRPLAIEDASLMIAMESMLQSGVQEGAVVKQLRSSMTASNDSTAPAFYSAVVVGLNGQEHLMRRFDRLHQKLQSLTE
jgi:hypothetical protein